APAELRNAQRRVPFEPFRLVMTDGASYEIRHPELLLIGERSAVVGVTKRPDQEFFSHSATLDLLHVIRIESALEESKPSNGSTAQ
ncbi:MAG: hypothetical protein ACRDD1_15300, partial [Planctomycetia bacterium]